VKSGADNCCDSDVQHGSGSILTRAGWAGKLGAPVQESAVAIHLWLPPKA